VPPALNAPPPEGLVLICPDEVAGGRLARALQRTVGPVSLSSSLAPLSHADAPVVAVYYDRLSPEQRDALGRMNSTSTPLLLLSREHQPDAFAELFDSRADNLLVLQENGPDAGDLLATLCKLRRGEIFGMEKYLRWGVELHPMALRSSEQRPAALETLNTYAASLGVPSRLAGLIGTVADEFMTNAFYNAPVRADRSRPYNRRHRTETVTLESDQQIELRYGSDGVRFGVSVTDPFGSLEPARIHQALARGFRGVYNLDTDDGGAGLGLYHVLNSLSHFVINIDPGNRTEMIGLIDISGAFRRFAAAGRSFNLFVLETTE